ncbi:MAG: response regulator [Roseateles sp.]|uniref:response regulator n=1 Tax=Roseateles sp. TaxID=1971397 RepID=UPI00403609D8
MPSPARRPVLYVEDHPVNALLMAAIFERRPELELVVATNGEEALCLAAGLNPALLLLDLGLPDCHGSRLLGLLRSLPGCDKVPAVAVTAELGFDIYAWGFHELWPKPLYVDEVLSRLDALIGTRPSPPPELPRELLLPAQPAVATLTQHCR